MHRIDDTFPVSTLQAMKLDPRAIIPRRHSELASGYDLHALESVTLHPGVAPVLVRTGIAIATPPGIEAQIRPRSSLSKKGVQVSLGTIDADYRGEIIVCMHLPLFFIDEQQQMLVNSFIINPEDRIAQLVFAPVAANTMSGGQLEEVTRLSQTKRGSGGFGSTNP